MLVFRTPLRVQLCPAGQIKFKVAFCGFKRRVLHRIWCGLSIQVFIYHMQTYKYSSSEMVSTVSVVHTNTNMT